MAALADYRLMAHVVRNIPLMNPRMSLALHAAPPRRLATIEALVDPRALGTLFGPVAAVRRMPIATEGRSGATHERVEVQLESGPRLVLWLKRNRLADDWEARRSGDAVGREVAVLAEPALAGIWKVFHCPFRAFAVEPGTFGLLMDDLGPYVPSFDRPLTEAQEDALLAALATLHARFWNAAVLDLPWLLSVEQALTILAPYAPDEEARLPSPPPIFHWVREGWEALFRRAPAPVVALLREPRPAMARLCQGLPRTLLHGDTRVHNFAFLEDGRVAAFDWVAAAAAQATLDIGWYLILNARYRARPHDHVLARYRAFLEPALQTSLSSDVWERMVAAGVLYGAAMLLWDRTLDLEDGLPGAAEEWSWWIERLQPLARPV
jgi:hypothetical protein